MAEQLDQDVVNLAKAIRQVETGNRPVQGASGELASRYQYLPSTWKETAAKYLGDPNAPLTLENENKATYLKIKDWKESGYGPDQIASMWNSGQPEWEGKVGTNKYGVKYDVPSYVQKVGNEYQKIKQTSSANQYKPLEYTSPSISVNRTADEAAKQQYGALFTPNTQDPSAFAESVKLVGNIPKSAFNFAKGALDIINPVSIFNRIKESVDIFKEIQEINKETGKITGQAPSTAQQIFSSTPSAAYQTLIPEAARGLISAGGGALTGDDQRIDEGLKTAQRALVSDPVGQIAPLLIASKYGAEKMGRGATFDRGISNVARPVTRAFESIGRKTGETARYAGSQATGLQPETLRQITQTPEAFSKKSKAAIDRVSLGKEVQSSLARRLEVVKETGALYEPIRNLGTTVNISKGWLGNTLQETTGLTLKNGKFQATSGSKIRTPSDVRAIQQLYDTYKPAFEQGRMTPNEFLNLRSDLAEMARFERQIGKSKPVETVGKQTRAKLNEAYRDQIKGLKELDETYRPQINELRNLSKGLVNKEGQLTDTAINRIANATGKGKDFLLARLEEVSPGITQKIKVLKAVEDIQNTSGIKVGTYSRTGLIAGAGIGLGVLQAIVTAILTSPEIAVPILRRYGILKNSKAVRQVINALKKVNEIPENLPPVRGQEATTKNIIPPGRQGAFSAKKISTRQKTTARYNNVMEKISVNTQPRGMALGNTPAEQGIKAVINDAQGKPSAFTRKSIIPIEIKKSTAKPREISKEMLLQREIDTAIKGRSRDDYIGDRHLTEIENADLTIPQLKRKIYQLAEEGGNMDLIRITLDDLKARQ